MKDTEALLLVLNTYQAITKAGRIPGSVLEIKRGNNSEKVIQELVEIIDEYCNDIGVTVKIKIE